MLHCPVYSDLRKVLFDKAAQIKIHFLCLDASDKLIFLFTNAELLKLCAKPVYKFYKKDMIYYMFKCICQRFLNG